MPICPRCGKCLCTEQSLEYHLSKKKRCDIPNLDLDTTDIVLQDPIFKLLQSDLDFESSVIVICNYFKILAINKYDNEIKNHTNFIMNLAKPQDFVNIVQQKQIYSEFHTTFMNGVCAKIRMYKTKNMIYIKKTTWE